MLPTPAKRWLARILNSIKEFSGFTDEEMNELISPDQSPKTFQRRRTADRSWDDKFIKRVIRFCSSRLGTTPDVLEDLIHGRARTLADPLMTDIAWASSVWSPHDYRRADPYDETLSRYERYATRKIAWRRLPLASLVYTRCSQALTRGQTEGIKGTRRVAMAINRHVKNRRDLWELNGFQPRNNTIVSPLSMYEAIIDRAPPFNRLDAYEDDARQIFEETLAAIMSGTLSHWLVNDRAEEIRRRIKAFIPYDVVAMTGDRLIVKRPAGCVYRTVHKRADDGSNRWFFEEYHAAVFEEIRPILLPAAPWLWQKYRDRWGQLPPGLGPNAA